MIKKILFALLIPVASYAYNFDQLIEKSGLPKSSLGIDIIQNGQSVYSLNTKQKFIPASLSKILTGIAGFKAFGSGYRFETQLLADASIQNQVLNGKLYLKGGGDPSLVSENMWVLVNHFVRNNIKKIQGPIVVDNSVYDEQFIDSSREDARVDRAYDSPVSAAPFNWNTVGIYVRPADKAGSPPNIVMDPDNTYFRIVNKAQTNSGAGLAIQVNRVGHDIIVSGKIGASAPEKAFYKNIDDPVQWVGRGLMDFLAQRGIDVVNKKIEAGKVPGGAKTLATAEGWSIDELLSGMLRFSNNFIAEMITKNLGLQAGNSQGTISGGIKHIKKLMVEYGVPESEYEFVNPSGLTRDNKIAPEMLGKILEGARKDFLVSGGFMNGLPFPTGEGSLSKRMKGLDEKRWVRAKTGLLTGVVGLAGYVGQKKKDPIAFVFIYNGNGREDKARALFDQMAMEMVER